MSAQLAACPSFQAELILNGLSIGPTLGVAYIGICISAMLFGLTACQCFYYYRSSKFKIDHWFVKSLVAFLMAIGTAQEALIIHMIYYYLVKNYYNPCVLLEKTVWSNPAQIALNAFVDVTVEGFLTYRGWRLGRNIWLTGICSVLVVAESLLTLAYPIRLLLEGPVFSSLDNTRNLGIATLATAVAADFCVTATLVHYLARSRTGFKKTNSLVTRLIILTVSTGALTALIVLADLIAYLISTTTFYVVFFNFLIGKMYINAVFTQLNTRGMMSAFHSAAGSKPINSIPMFHRSGDDALPRTPHTGDYPMEVTVHHDVEIDNSSELSQDKLPDMQNDRFVLSSTLFHHPPAKEKVIEV